MMSSLLAMGEKERKKKNHSRKQKPFFLGGGTLTILGALMPISVALRLARAIIGREVRLMVSLTASGGRALRGLLQL